MPVMADRKKPSRKGSRHKDRHTVALRGDEYAQLEILAERNNRPLVWELRRILIEALKEEGLWPPQPDTSKPQ